MAGKAGVAGRRNRTLTTLRTRLKNKTDNDEVRERESKFE